MKIAIIGKGTSAIIMALNLIKEGYEIEFFYDPESPHLSVGESTTPHIGDLISEVFNISIGRLADKGIVSFKNGIRFIGWGKQETFRHHFNDNSLAFQFESGILNPFIHDLLVKEYDVAYHAERVDGWDINPDKEKIIINEKEYDFMINCSGWNNQSEYYEPYFKTVNSAILYKEDSIVDPTYTLHRATPHGWQFGLPFPDRGITKCGYLYNSTYDNVEEIESLFKNKEYKKISWTPKYNKKIIENRFIAYNGNRLFFFEPLQALSLLYYNTCSDIIIKFLNNNRSTHSYYSSNKEYLQLMYEYHIALAFHYQYGSKYDTKFWKETTRSAKDYLNHNPNHREENLYNAFYADKVSRRLDNNLDSILSLACFQDLDFRDIHEGMLGINLYDLKKNPDIFHYPPIEHPHCNLK